ncbi:MAG: hypothetical protein RDV48_28850 [Candidatus Eremiobacteraeota bacterium]|nr:hypothetical protein [Candidatus Eremiobacteraeota bacterium]
MKLVLQRLEETPDELVPGEIMGEVSLEENGELKFSLSDRELEARLRELFSKPIQALSGDPSGNRNVTYATTVKPGTPEFFTHVLPILEGRGYRLTGRIEE